MPISVSALCAPGRMAVSNTGLSSRGSGGIRFAIADAFSRWRSDHLGDAHASLKLITGGLGIGPGLVQNVEREGLLEESRSASAAVEDRAVVLADGGAPWSRH
jgi:uncharacterized protein YgbK (DUF1537 family)